MEPVEIHIRHEVFARRAMVGIGLSIAILLPVLYAYALLGTIDFLHPIQTVYACFGAIFSTVCYWLVAATILFCTLAYRTTNYKVTNEKLRSPASSLPLIFNSKSLLQAAAHAGASFALAYVLTSMIGGRYGDIIVDCGTSGRCLNEYKWFTMVFAAITGFLFSLEMSAFGGYCLQFYANEKLVVSRLQEGLPYLIKSSTRAVRRTFVVYYLCYLLLGGTTVSLARSLFFLQDDPSVGLKSWWSLFDLRLLYQAYIVGVCIRFTWSVSLFLFQYCITKHARFELSDTRGEASLLSALELKQDNLTKMLAFKDLHMMSMLFCDERRQQVFSLSMPRGHPKMWATIRAATVGSLDELLQRIESNNSTLLAAQKDIVSHQASKIETLKPGYNTANKGGASKEGANSSRPWYHPALLHKPYPDHLSGQIFFDSRKHLWSLSALSTLVTRSFSEDKFGIVQQSMGEIITLLLNINQALENLFRMAPALGKQPEALDMNRNSQTTGIELRLQMKAALESIATTFHPHLNQISGLNSDQVKQLLSLVK